MLETGLYVLVVTAACLVGWIIGEGVWHFARWWWWRRR